MTTNRGTVTDALIARALAERAQGPDVNLVPAIMAATTAAPRTRAVRSRPGFTRRSAVLVLVVAVLTTALVTAGIVGSGILRPKLIDRPLPRNGAITVSSEGTIREFDPLAGQDDSDALAPLHGLPTHLDWSRDGARLAISTDLEVSVYDAVTGNARKLLPCGYCGATWSPDGSSLTIVDARNVISSIDPEDGHMISRIEPDLAYVDNIQGVSWSPDGRRLAISGSNADHSTARLAIIERDGSNVQPISLPTQGGQIIDASWSPDGSTIAYIGFGVADPDGSMSMLLALVDPDGVRPSQTFGIGVCFCLGFSPNLTWSPDGRTIAFTSLIEMGSHLFVANADGSGIHPIRAGGIGPLAWRPLPE